jgi:hypothetical protein
MPTSLECLYTGPNASYSRVSLLWHLNDLVVYTLFQMPARHEYLEGRMVPHGRLGASAQPGGVNGRRQLNREGRLHGLVPPVIPVEEGESDRQPPRVEVRLWV